MFNSRQAKPIFVSAEALFELERELSEPLFRRVPIGSTLGDLFTIELFIGQGKWGFKSVNLDRLRYWYHFLRGLRFLPELVASPPRPILFTWLDERPHLKDMVLPLVKALGPSRCTVLGRTASMAKYLPPGTAFLTSGGLPQLNMKDWRQEYERCAPEWHRKIKTFLRRHEIPLVVFHRLADTLLSQSQKVTCYGRFLDQSRPQAVITEYDRNIHASCLILAARARGIHTMTMIHGVINPPYGYTPLLADVAFCWGERHRQQMIKMGTPAERLVTVGCQRLSRSLTCEPSVTKAKVGLATEKPLALLATNPIHPEYRRRLARIFCEGVASQSLFSGAVRLHPSEKLGFYAEEIAAFPMIRFMANNELTLDEALAAADVVVCHNSEFGNDALIKGKLAVVIDLPPLPLGNGHELAESAGCPIVLSKDELSALLNRIFYDGVFRNELRECSTNYVNNFCAAFGKDAIRNICSVILDCSAKFDVNQPNYMI